MGKPDLAAVFVGGMRLGAVGIEPRRGGWRVATGDRAKRVGANGRRWVCGSGERATMIADASRPVLHKLSASASIEDAAECVSATARALGVLLVDENRIREQAEAIVQKVEAEFESLVARGELRSVNAGYRQYRLATVLEGKKPIGYPTFITNYKLKMIQAVAQHSRINVFENARDIEK